MVYTVFGGGTLCSWGHIIRDSSSLSVFVMLKINKIATWLILPVVIRSSQRLSHACLSIKTFYT